MAEISQAPEYASLLTQCWFGTSDVLGCFIDAHNPSIYLSLGEALGAFGIIFAVYQLRSVKWRLVLDVRPKWQRMSVWILGISGLIFALFAFLQPQMARQMLHPNFLELLGFLCLAFAPLSLLFFGMRHQGIFTRESAKRFYQVIAGAIASGKPEYLEAAIEILGANLKSVALWAAKYRPSNEGDIESEEMAAANFAAASLDLILSDRSVVEHITTKRLDFMNTFFWALKENRVPRGVVNHATRAITQSLLLNKNSILHRQLDGMGFSLSSNLYRQLFKDTGFFAEYRPLDEWFGYAEHDEFLDPIYTKVFLEALKSACEGYWKNGGYSHHAFNGVFGRLEGHMQKLGWTAYRSAEQSEVVLGIFGTIGSFLHHTFPWALIHAKQAGQLREDDLECLMGQYSAESLAGHYVETVIQLLECLTFIRPEHWNRLRFHVIEALRPMTGLGFTGIPTSLPERFSECCWEKIKANVEHGHFPEITRMIFIAFAHSPGHYGPLEKMRDDFIDYIRAELAPRLQRDEKMANRKTLMVDALIPPEIYFNKESGSFYSVNGLDEKHPLLKSTEVALLALPQGSSDVTVTSEPSSNMKEKLEKVRERVRLTLPTGDVTNEVASHILRRYTAAIESNFVAWMGAATITVRSVQGRYASQENLWVEMKDDHAGMLRKFAKNASAEPTTSDYTDVADAVANIRAMVGEMSGLKTLTLMAVLENTSVEFIPLLEKFAVQLGSSNTSYTKAHGEADAAHAQQFVWALEQEKAHYTDAESTIDAAIETTLSFLEHVFKV